MTDADVIAAIKANHLKANIAEYEADETVTIRWDEATVDRGGTVFGPGPYLKVPLMSWVDCEVVVVRVYAPARLRRRLAAQWSPS